jgi:aspartate aminotransferase
MCAAGNWDHIVAQGGMFSLTGLSGPVIQRLQSRHHVYMLASGRISLAGLNSGNLARFVAAVVESIAFVNSTSSGDQN